MSDAAQHKRIERLRGRVESMKRQLDWLQTYCPSDWEAKRLAHIDTRLALSLLAKAEGK